jgi:putative SOS response-associated peptidase YedK
MEWGCIPYYIKDENHFKKNRPKMLNARSERILEDTDSYWYKIRNRRCLMPVTGIYEHREISGWKKKVPYYIWLKDQRTFFIPGLYSVAELPDMKTDELVKRWTFTIITRPANDIMKMIHNGGDNKWRMPLFLSLELSKKWLREELSLQEYKAILDFEMPSEQLGYHTVDTIRTPKVRADNKDKYELFIWPHLPDLALEEAV